MNYKVFDSLLEPVFVVHSDLSVVYCNEPAGLLVDLSPRKIIRSKSKIDELFIWDQKVIAFESLTPGLDSTAYQELKFQTANNKTGRVQITVQSSWSDNEWICFFRDVTLEETLQKKYRAELEQKESYILELQKAKSELELYSQNLEKMVHERTAEIKNLNISMQALLDSLSQGFLIFDSNGLCSKVYSKACLEVLESEPAGRQIWDLLKLSPKESESFKKWMLTVFSEMLPFEDLAPLGPPRFNHSQGHKIKLSYFPIRDENGKIESLVLVAEDITRLIAAEEQAEKDRAHVQMILSVLNHKKEIIGFYQESQRLITELEDLCEEMGTTQELNTQKAFILLHTLKGGAAQLHFFDLSQACHSAEDHLASYSQSSDWAERFRSFVSQFKTLRAQSFEQLTPVLGSIEKLNVPKKEVALAELQRFSTAVLPLSPSLHQDFFECFLAEPLSELLKPFEEMSLSLAEQEGKKLKNFIYTGSDIKVDPSVWGPLVSSLVHVFRNSIDHGLETPDQRLRAGKEEAGLICISMSEDPSAVELRVRDDGQGIDPDRIRAKVLSQGEDSKGLSDQEVLQLVFRPNLSLKEEVSTISGRGVGMDAVMANVKALGGTCSVNSRVGQGTEVVIQVPKQTLPALTLKSSA